MAHHHLPPAGTGLPCHGLAALQIYGHRLFQQQIVAFSQGRHRMGYMHPIHGADKQHIRQFRTGQQFFSTGKTVFRRHAIDLRHLPHIFRPWVGHGHDLHIVRVAQCTGRIAILPTGPGACDGHFDLLCHHAPSFYINVSNSNHFVPGTAAKAARQRGTEHPATVLGVQH